MRNGDARGEVQIELRGAPLRLLDDLESGRVANEYLVVGPAGTGKTFGILLLFHFLACEFPGSRWLFARKTRQSLSQSVLVTFEGQVLVPDGFGPMARTQRRFHRQSYVYPNGSEIVLAGFDRPDKILSTTYDGAYVNEGLECEEEDLQTLSGRLDRPDKKCPITLLVADCNPGDPAHWMKRRADEGRTALLGSKHEDNPSLWDKGGWTEAGRRYLSRLETLTGVWRKRYLAGVWAAGGSVWFADFDATEGGRDVHVGAECDPRLPVRLAVDPGVHTGAVFFQVAGETTPEVRVFADYFGEGLGIEDTVRGIREVAASRCGGRIDVGTVDPAAGARTGFGLITIEEYARAGLRLDPWPRRTVLEGLNLLGSFVGGGHLKVHPRCERLISAFANYRRKKVQGQWVDAPEDPQHPYEDMMDALRGGLVDKYPDGRKPDLKVGRVPARSVF